MKKRCAICLKMDKQNQMYQDSYYFDIWIHRGCLNTDKAKQWRDRKRSEDPGYDRYMDLISDGLVRRCKRCGRSNTISLKGVNFIWQVNCSQCHRVKSVNLNLFDEHDKSLYQRLQQMRELYFYDASDSAASKVQSKMESLASQYHKYRKCECGGFYSIAAKPRCIDCNEVISDSCFHYTAQDNSDEE